MLKIDQNKKNISQEFFFEAKFDQINSYSGLENAVKLAMQQRANPYHDLENFIQLANVAAQQLPESILQQLRDLKENRNEEGYLHFRGLPIDQNLASTPGEMDSFPPNKFSFASEFCLSAFASILGEPFNYIQEENGNIFRNIRPTQKNTSVQTSDCSKVLLELHTETAFHPFKPDFLLLYCLRGDRNKKAFTLVVGLKKIIQGLDEKLLSTLKKKEFRTGIDVSFGNTNKTQLMEDPISVLSGRGNDQMITYDLDLMKGITQEAKKALEQLKNVIMCRLEKVLLEPGDLLIIDNRRAVHGRAAFDAQFDGQDRWLQRVYVSKDTDFAQNVPISGRVIKK